jgi:propanol-preferring alcohol dehydrogenase
VAGIYLTDTPPLNYERELFYEKELRSVTSNTRDDGRQFLAFAIDHHVRATTHVYPMSQAQQALQDLKAGRFDGAAVLVNDRDTA